jgi:hypothetical protein
MIFAGVDGSRRAEAPSPKQASRVGASVVEHAGGRLTATAQPCYDRCKKCFGWAMTTQVKLYPPARHTYSCSNLQQSQTDRVHSQSRMLRAIETEAT